MERLVDKFGLCCQHLQHAIPKIKNSKDRTTLRGKFEKLINAKVLCSGFFIDILSAAKVFHLTTQKSDINIVSNVVNVESTKKGYEKLLKKFKTTPKQYYQSTNIQCHHHRNWGKRGWRTNLSISDIEILYTRKDVHEKSWCWIKSILSYYVERSSDVYSERNGERIVSDGDNILFHVFHVLKSAVWPDLTNHSDED